MERLQRYVPAIDPKVLRHLSMALVVLTGMGVGLLGGVAFGAWDDGDATLAVAYAGMGLAVAVAIGVLALVTRLVAVMFEQGTDHYNGILRTVSHHLDHLETQIEGLRTDAVLTDELGETEQLGV